MNRDNNLFIQFYTCDNSVDNRSRICFANGFSYTWNRCKEMGEFLWLRPMKYDGGDYLKLLDEYVNTIELPIEEGNVYVCSVFYAQDLHVIKLAYKYPKLNFIVGGRTPIDYWDKVATLPKNIKFTGDLVEKVLFDEDEASTEWNFELPKVPELYSAHTISVVHTVERHCYWGKCNFCSVGNDNTPIIHNDPKGINKIFEMDIPDNIKEIQVFLSGASLTSNWIDKYWSSLPVRDNLFYHFFLRGTKTELRSLKKAVKGPGPALDHCYALIGLEFPSDRVLRWINKGVMSADMLNFIKFVCDNNGFLTISMIKGWDILEESDVDEAIKYIETVQKYASNSSGNLIYHIHNLFWESHSRLYKEYKKNGKLNYSMVESPVGKRMYGYVPLSAEQNKLNDRFAQAVVDMTVKANLTYRNNIISYSSEEAAINCTHYHGVYFEDFVIPPPPEISG